MLLQTKMVKKCQQLKINLFEIEFIYAYMFYCIAIQHINLFTS